MRLRVSTIHTMVRSYRFENSIKAATLVWDQLMDNIRGIGEMDLTKMVCHSSQKTKTETKKKTHTKIKMKDRNKDKYKDKNGPDKDGLPPQSKDRPTFRCPLQAQPVITIWE